MDDLHRIGGGAIDNLRLKPAEAAMTPPGISVLRSPTPKDAADQMRAAYPSATGLHEAAKTVGSASDSSIRAAGFEAIPIASRRLPNHHRIVHPDGAAGFTDENLKILSEAFTDTTGH